MSRFPQQIRQALSFRLLYPFSFRFNLGSFTIASSFDLFAEGVCSFGEAVVRSVRLGVDWMLMLLTPNAEAF
jgi:hypothetical protein